MIIRAVPYINRPNGSPLVFNLSFDPVLESLYKERNKMLKANEHMQRMIVDPVELADCLAILQRQYDTINAKIDKLLN